MSAIHCSMGANRVGFSLDGAEPTAHDRHSMTDWATRTWGEQRELGRSGPAGGHSAGRRWCQIVPDAPSVYFLRSLVLSKYTPRDRNFFGGRTAVLVYARLHAREAEDLTRPPTRRGCCQALVTRSGPGCRVPERWHWTPFVGCSATCPRATDPGSFDDHQEDSRREARADSEVE